MEYICKNCGSRDTADTIEDIVKYRKLCSKCLSNINNKYKRKTKPKKHVKKHVETAYVCNTCGKLYYNKHYNVKPFNCSECFSRSIVAISYSRYLDLKKENENG